MEIRRINGYTETVYKEIEITDKKSLVVCTSERESDGSLLADIRQFRLYKTPGTPDDGKMRPTNRGIKFRVENIPELVAGLIAIYKDNSDITEPELVGMLSNAVMETN